MGIYTNINESYNAVDDLDYKKYGINVNEHMNFVTMGMEAIVECEANRAAFDRAIALEELAAFEQTGSTEVFYEGVSLKAIWEKIKAFFKAIAEKVKKIFAAFIGKMDIVFRSNESFAKKYGGEIRTNWSKASKFWSTYGDKKWSEFKGYVYTGIPGSPLEKHDYLSDATIAKLLFRNVNTGSSLTTSIKNFIENKDSLNKLYELVKQPNTHLAYDKLQSAKGKYPTEYVEGHENVNKLVEDINKTVSSLRDSFKETTRKEIRKGLVDGELGEDDNFNEAIFKCFRNGEKEKSVLKWDDITKMYSSADNLVTFISKFDKIKTSIQSDAKAFTTSMDNLIASADKAAKDVEGKNGTNLSSINESVVSIAHLYKDIWGAIKEDTLAISTGQLQATKEAVSQAKAIAVKIAGMKNMTERNTNNESYDYSTDGDFISKVQFV